MNFTGRPVAFVSTPAIAMTLLMRCLLPKLPPTVHGITLSRLLGTRSMFANVQGRKL